MGLCVQTPSPNPNDEVLLECHEVPEILCDGRSEGFSLVFSRAHPYLPLSWMQWPLFALKWNAISIQTRRLRKRNQILPFSVLTLTAVEAVRVLLGRTLSQARALRA